MGTKPREAILFLFAALGAAWALIQIYSWFVAPSKKLVGTASFSNVQLPSGMLHSLEALSLLSRTNALAALGADRHEMNAQTATAAQDIRDKLNAFVSQNLHDIDVSFYPSIGGYLSIEIVNSGTQSLSAVRARIPAAVYTEVGKPDGRIESNRASSPFPMFGQSDTIEIGTLQPRDRATVTAWMRGSISVYQAREIELVHDSGIGTTYLYGPANGTGRFVSSFVDGFPNGPSFLMVIVFALLLTQFAFKVWSQRGKPVPALTEISKDDDDTP